MTSAAIEIVDGGAANTVQDAGRLGHRAIGVPVGGTADPLLAACANRLLGNADGDALIEMPLVGPTVRAAQAPVRCALAGDVQAQLLRGDNPPLPVAPFQTVTLQPGEALRVGAVRRGVAYLALAGGGCLTSPQLGSRSTYVRAGLGGVQGRTLQAGDRVAMGAWRGEPSSERRAKAFVHEAGPIRVMLGPQDDAFDPASVATLLREPFRVSREVDRMGMRLEGPTLRHLHGADLCSEGVVPGSIQVPGNGSPIILLVDAQTVGGYTKIGTVIRADLPRLAHARAGDELRFIAVTRAQALQARALQRLSLEAWTAGIEPYQPPGSLDLERLYNANLLSGAIDARRDALPWE